MPQKIKFIRAREILSSGSLPTIEAIVTLDNNIEVKASVPFGVSSGANEAFTLLDGDEKRYLGFGMMKAVENIDTIIQPQMKGQNPLQQQKIDQTLIELDGTENKKRLGGNTLLAVSLAVCKAAAQSLHLPLYQYIRQCYSFSLKGYLLPKPMMVLIEGGKHAVHSTDIQEFMIVPMNFSQIKENIRVGAEIYLTLGKLLKDKGMNVNTGNEGAYAPPDLLSNQKPFELIQEAIAKAGYQPKEEVMMAVDCAASEFYKNKNYYLEREGKVLTSRQMIDYYERWLQVYPIFSIEDPLAEDDWTWWQIFTQKFGNLIKVVGDDLTVTDKKRLQKALDKKACNAIIIKPNQIGTLTETIETVKMAKDRNIITIVSHRGGGETNDTFIMDLAVACNSDFVKVGISRGERVGKYNRLMEIEEELKTSNQ